MAQYLTHYADTKTELFRSLTVDTHDPNVFTFEQHLIAANIPAYTPPAPAR